MLALTLIADLSGVTDLQPLDTQESPYFYTFKVQCTSCRETHPNFISLNRHEMNEVSGSRGEANFVWRCKSCKRESTATIVGPPNAYKPGSQMKAQEIVRIDCRGLEFTEFFADGEWLAVGVDSATKFAGIELDQGEWYDYDEKAGEEVSVKDVKWGIRKV